ncbi:MAG: hypothetical protein JWO31_2777 [Phycisphaerales bacterium]|nr:hypothetical protein [Phycisphaerales bacterium]
MAYEYVVQTEDGAEIGGFLMGGGFRDYQLPNGEHCPVPEAPAWCNNCRAFVAAERVPSLPEIDEELNAARSGGAGYRSWLPQEGNLPWRDDDAEFWDEFAYKAVTRATQTRTWRLLRRGPPRCLLCASTSVMVVEEGKVQIAHPITGQQLRIHWVGHVRVSDDEYYTVEGLPISSTTP